MAPDDGRIWIPVRRFVFDGMIYIAPLGTPDPCDMAGKIPLGLWKRLGASNPDDEPDNQYPHDAEVPASALMPPELLASVDRIRERRRLLRNGQERQEG